MKVNLINSSDSLHYKTDLAVQYHELHSQVMPSSTYSYKNIQECRYYEPLNYTIPPTTSTTTTTATITT